MTTIVGESKIGNPRSPARRILGVAKALIAAGFLCSWIGSGFALADPLQDCLPPTSPEIVVNGGFSEGDGFSGWLRYYPGYPAGTDPFHKDTTVGAPAPSAKIDPGSCTDPWCVKLRQWGGRWYSDSNPLLDDLEPDTVYQLRFRAKAASGTPTISAEIYLRRHGSEDTAVDDKDFSLLFAPVSIDQDLKERRAGLRHGP